MFKILMSFADSIKYVPEKPECTAKKTVGWDVLFQTWPTRDAMAKTIRKQQRRSYKQDDWRPVIPLQDTEGY